MGRRLRSNIPQTIKTLTPQWPHLKDFRVANSELKLKQKSNYDSRHGTKPLADIPNDETLLFVHISTKKQGSEEAHVSK